MASLLEASVEEQSSSSPHQTALNADGCDSADASVTEIEQPPPPVSQNQTEIEEGQDAYRFGGDKNEFIALKMLSAECYAGEQCIWEREILIRLRNGDHKHLGYAYVCHLVDDFEHQGPNDIHVCLVFELMGETLRSFGAWFSESMVPNVVMRRFTIQLLLALDFAHEHGVIHTDIKPDNIFVKFRDHSLIESYFANVEVPEQDRSKRYSPIPSRPLRRYYFNEADSQRVAEFDISLGDWGLASWADKHLTEKIQPVALRSPEVLISALWDKTTDWWNLRAVILEVFRAIRMFSGRGAAKRAIPRQRPSRRDCRFVWTLF